MLLIVSFENMIQMAKLAVQLGFFIMAVKAEEMVLYPALGNLRVIIMVK